MDAKHARKVSVNNCDTEPIAEILHQIRKAAFDGEFEILGIDLSHAQTTLLRNLGYKVEINFGELCVGYDISWNNPY